MTWIKEAVHVARKDAVHSRAALVIYSVIVAVTLVASLMQPNVGGDFVPISVATTALMLFGVILTASAVQADSPTQSNAFWASRPFHPTAMLSAKLLYAAALIIGIPLIAELIGLKRFDAPAGFIAASLIRSFSVYALLIVCTVIVAGLTPDLRGFIVAALLLFGGLLCIALVFAWPPARGVDADGPGAVAFTLSWAIDLFGTAGAAALLVWLYRRRDVSRVAWVGAALVVGACLMQVARVDTLFAKVPEAAASSRAIAIDTFSFGQVRDNNGPMLHLSFRAAPLTNGDRLSVAIVQVTARLRDGSSITAEPTFGRLLFWRDDALLPTGIHAYRGEGAGTANQTNVRFKEADLARIARVGIASVSARGRAYITTAEPIMTSTFGTLTTRAIGGTRVRIGNARGNDPAVLALNTATLGTASVGFDASPISLMVVNGQRAEGIVLSSSQSMNSSSWMVLPGAPLRTSQLLFNTEDPYRSPSDQRTFVGSLAVSETGSTGGQSVGRRQFPDPSWYPAAKLTVLRWKPVSTFEISASKAIP